jgi:negative regulator of replication initiation
LGVNRARNVGKTLANHGNIKKAKLLPSTPGWKQVVRFLEGEEKMTMIRVIRDENGEDSVSVSMYWQSE